MYALTDAGQRPDAKLLVVEDEPNILELLSASLRYAGFDVVTAAAGTEAVQAAQRYRPDLIVLDVMLPDMDGFDVVRRLRGGGARIPVVFLTARDATDDKIRGLTLGGDDYVTKPFSLKGGIARIRAGLGRPREAGAEPTPRLPSPALDFDTEGHEACRPGGPGRAAGQLSSRTSLRTKLITALLALVIIALAAISVSSGWLLRSNLTSQDDPQLQSVFGGNIPPPVGGFVPGLTYQVQHTN